MICSVFSVNTFQWDNPGHPYIGIATDKECGLIIDSIIIGYKPVYTYLTYIISSCDSLSKFSKYCICTEGNDAVGPWPGSLVTGESDTRLDASLLGDLSWCD